MIARKLIAAVSLVVVVLSGCGRPASSEAARFDNQSGNDAVTCLAHQRSRPDAAYEGGLQARTLLVLTMLHYYVANGNKPYCDGRPPGKVDRAWLSVYLRLGADPGQVVHSTQPLARSAPGGGTP